VVTLDRLVAGGAARAAVAAPAAPLGGGRRGLGRVKLVVAGGRGQRAVARVGTDGLADLRSWGQHNLAGGARVLEAAVGQTPWLVVVRGPREVGDLGGRRCGRRIRTHVVDSVGPEAGVHRGDMLTFKPGGSNYARAANYPRSDALLIATPRINTEPQNMLCTQLQKGEIRLSRRGNYFFLAGVLVAVAFYGTRRRITDVLNCYRAPRARLPTSGSVLHQPTIERVARPAGAVHPSTSSPRRRRKLSQIVRFQSLSENHRKHKLILYLKAYCGQLSPARKEIISAP